MVEPFSPETSPIRFLLLPAILCFPTEEYLCPSHLEYAKCVRIPYCCLTLQWLLWIKFHTNQPKCFIHHLENWYILVICCPFPSILIGFRGLLGEHQRALGWGIVPSIFESTILMKFPHFFYCISFLPCPCPAPRMPAVPKDGPEWTATFSRFQWHQLILSSHILWCRKRPYTWTSVWPNCILVGGLNQCETT